MRLQLQMANLGISRSVKKIGGFPSISKGRDQHISSYIGNSLQLPVCHSHPEDITAMNHSAARPVQPSILIDWVQGGGAYQQGVVEVGHHQVGEGEDREQLLAANINGDRRHQEDDTSS